MAESTITAKPAAGPLTPSGESLIKPTTMPPTMPAIIPEKRGAPEARAMPKQRGTATRKTTIDAGMSFLKFEKSKYFFIVVGCFLKKRIKGNRME